MSDMGKKPTKRRVPQSLHRRTLATNLEQLMGHTALSSSPKLAKGSGISIATINRIRRREVAADLDTIDALARAWKLAPWQLLVPNVNPLELPILATGEEAAALRRVQAALVAAITASTS